VGWLRAKRSRAGLTLAGIATSALRGDRFLPSLAVSGKDG